MSSYLCPCHAGAPLFCALDYYNNNSIYQLLVLLNLQPNHQSNCPQIRLCVFVSNKLPTNRNLNFASPNTVETHNQTLKSKSQSQTVCVASSGTLLYRGKSLSGLWRLFSTNGYPELLLPPLNKPPRCWKPVWIFLFTCKRKHTHTLMISLNLTIRRTPGARQLFTASCVKWFKATFDWFYDYFRRSVKLLKNYHCHALIFYFRLTINMVYEFNSSKKLNIEHLHKQRHLKVIDFYYCIWQ